MNFIKSYIPFIIASFFLLVTCSNKKNTNQRLAKNEAALHENIPKQEKTDPNLAAFSFEKEFFDFGDITQGEIVEHVFKFTNTGSIPLIITNTHVTCGCTTPQYTKEPIAPGEAGEILVKFNSTGKVGVQNKRITINANVKNGSSFVSIRTNVKQKEK